MTKQIYETVGEVNLYAIDTGEMFKYKGEVELWAQENDEDYVLTEEDIIRSFEHTCKRRGQVIPNAKIVIIRDKEDHDYDMRAWINMTHVKEIINK